MKKLMIGLTICLALVNTAKADCWGTELAGGNGNTYCFSDQAMNWYSAFAWCNAQGKHLVSANELCDYRNNVWGKNTTNCSNARAFSESWTTNIDSDGKAYTAGGHGASTTPRVDKTSNRRAACF